MHKKNTRDDHIIFREDEDIFSDMNQTQQFGNTLKSETSGMHTTSGKGGLKKGQISTQMKRENMTDKDWETKFEMLMNEDLIQLPDDFYDEELYYKDPNDLNTIFSELEEKNLYLIHMSQEVEQSLETQK